MKYFAYGSNMLDERLRAPKRVPDAVLIGVALIQGYALRFHKKSNDGSGKCNMFQTGSQADVVYGVLFDVPQKQLKSLDEAEGYGQGYHHEPVKVRLSDGNHLCAITFIADDNTIDDSRTPYDWYHELVVAGAEQHKMPRDYISAIKAIRSVPDPKAKRKSKLEAEAALRAYRAQQEGGK
jgi:gamma-glutamylcyclotransferase